MQLQKLTLINSLDTGLGVPKRSKHYSLVRLLERPLRRQLHVVLGALHPGPVHNTRHKMVWHKLQHHPLSLAVHLQFGLVQLKVHVHVEEALAHRSGRPQPHLLVQRVMVLGEGEIVIDTDTVALIAIVVVQGIYGRRLRQPPERLLVPRKARH